MAAIESVDVLATDPPYSERTHDGERGMRIDRGGGRRPRNAISYAPIDEAQVRAFVASWAGRVRRWVLIFGDSYSNLSWRGAWDAIGWTTFAPVIWHKQAAPPRFAGDGPQSCCEYICVARPPGRVREHASRPGIYHVRCETGCPTGGSVLSGRGATGVIGTKDVGGLVRLLSDYSRPGDVVADPYAGSATVGEACVRTGRRYVGAECDPATWEIGRRRLDLALADPVAHDRWALGRQRALFPAEGTEGR